MADYLGTYYSEEIDTTYKVEMKDSLVITRRKYPDTELSPVRDDKDKFDADISGSFSGVLSETTVEFMRDGERVVGLRVSDKSPFQRVLNFEFKKSR